MQDLTTGSITRHLLKTTSFMLVTMVFQTLYFLVDLYWVGRLGKEAVAAVGIAGNLTFIVLARDADAGRRHDDAGLARRRAQGPRTRAAACSTSRRCCRWSSARCSWSSAMAAAPCLRAHARAPTRRRRTLAAEYLLWFIPAMALQFAMVAMGAALRGTGNFKPGMIVQTATVILNMVLAPFLIFGWVTGDGRWASPARRSPRSSRSSSARVWLSTYFLKPSAYLQFAPTLTGDRELPLWGQMLKIGLPAGAEFALMAVYLCHRLRVSRPFGAAAQAGFGIGLRDRAGGLHAGRGAGIRRRAGRRPELRRPARRSRAGRRSRRRRGSPAALMVLFAVVCHIAPAAMVGVFSHDPHVIAVGDEYLRIVSWNFVASGIIFVGSSMFQAMGNTIPPLIASCLRLVLVGVPILVLSRDPHFTLRWVWYLSVTAVTLQMIVNLFLLRREFNIRLRLDRVVPV